NLTYPLRLDRALVKLDDPFATAERLYEPAIRELHGAYCRGIPRSRPSENLSFDIANEQNSRWAVRDFRNGRDDSALNRGSGAVSRQDLDTPQPFLPIIVAMSEKTFR